MTTRTKQSAGRAVTLLFLGLCLWGSSSTGARARWGSVALTVAERITLIEEALVLWDVDLASWHADVLVAEHGSSAPAMLAAARTSFHESRYHEARERALKGSKGKGHEAVLSAQFVDYLDERMEAWDDFEEHASENFLLRVTAKDRVLVPLALSALEAAATAMQEELGFCPSRKVVVEIYPSRRTFIAASTLTREEVETSGTVAICHFNRLMLMSPGVMSKGYDWLDTLCHEYVHYTVYHLGRDTVPVWLHEGLAKVLESRWRLPEPADLDPRLTSILAEGRDTGTWVTFRQMHPSMAKLPNASLVSLAFAEVAAAIQMVREEGGPESLHSLVAAVRDSAGQLDPAFIQEFSRDVESFEEKVKEFISAKDLYRVPGLLSLDAAAQSAKPFEFVDEGEVQDPEEEARKLSDRKARDWVVLGDRLRGRDFHQAAIIEYDKALRRLGQAEPLVTNRMAHAMISSGRMEEAIPLLEESLVNHPTLTTTLDNLAEVHVRLAALETDADSTETRRTEAVRLLRRSENINPFNPDTHLRLVTLLVALGRDNEAELSRERLRLVRNR